MSAGTRYRAQQETAAESARLNATRPAAPRTAPAPAPRDTPRPSRASESATAPRSTGSPSTGRPGGSSGRSSASRPLLPRQKGQKGAPGAHNYQAIILAEFVAAELLVSMTPIAARKGQPGLSPYVPRDMTKLLAIGMSYFLLELAAVTGKGAGRFGAWFGLLILLAVGLNEAANVTKVLDLFGGGKDATTSQSSGDPTEKLT